MSERNTSFSAIDEKFENARSYAARIKQTLQDFLVMTRGGASDWVQPVSLKKAEDLITKLTAIEEELAKPTLKIAMIGTTSSGKSTLLNAMLGRKLAPIESGEMSAGVLRIRHGEELGMTVLETQGMIWPSGKYDLHKDSEIYEALRNSRTGIMAQYRSEINKEKNTIEILAPQIEITAPLAPKCGGIPDLNFPEKINLEFFDLPGLKSEKDRKNLEIIQQYLANAFLIVVLNYDDSDSDKREKLLQEIYNNVMGVTGNKKAVIYVLNKVDNHKSTDDPIEDRCSELSEAIKKKLDLDELPEVIPVSALPLFFIQTAFGVYSIKNEMAGQDPDFVEKQIASFYEDCLKPIKSMKKSSQEKKQWFNDHDEEEDGNWDYKNIYQLLEWTYEYSNVNKVWSDLEQKLHSQLNAVVIAPIFGKFFEEFETLVRGLLEQERILGINTSEEVEVEKKQLSETLIQMQGKISQFKASISDRLQSALTKLQNQDQSVQADMIDDVFTKQFNTLRQIRLSLLDTIAQPILKDLSEESSLDKSSLQDQLKEVISVELANKIERCISSLAKAGYDIYSAKGGISKTWPEADIAKNDEYKKILNIKERLLNLFFEVKQAFAKRGEFLLQLHVYSFSDDMQKLLQDQIKILYSELGMVVGNKYSALKPYAIQGFSINFQLPDDIFEIPNEIKSAKFTIQESYKVDTGSCSSETRTRNKGMITENIPSINHILIQWKEGISKGENAIWQKMYKAIEEITISEINRISNTLTNNGKIIEDSLNSQFERLKQDKQKLLAFARNSLKPMQKASESTKAYNNELVER